MSGKKSILSQLNKAGNQQEQRLTGSKPEPVVKVEENQSPKGADLLGDVRPPENGEPSNTSQNQNNNHNNSQNNIQNGGEVVSQVTEGVLPMESVLLPFPEFGLKPKTNVTVMNEVLAELKKLSLAHSMGSGKKVDVNHMVNTVLAHWLSLTKREREKYTKKYL